MKLTRGNKAGFATGPNNSLNRGADVLRCILGIQSPFTQQNQVIRSLKLSEAIHEQARGVMCFYTTLLAGLIKDSHS